MRIGIAAFAVSAILLGCKQYQPTQGISNLNSANAARECKDKHILSIKAGSKVGWEVTELKDSKQGVLSGSNVVSGFFEVKNNDMTNASGKFYFDARTTSSGDRDRDSQLMKIVFGLSQKMEFSFLLTGFKGGSLPSGNAQGLEALGTLLINGQSTNVDIPVMMTERLGGYRLENRGDFLINMRAQKTGVNSMNLDPELKQLLSFVPGMDVLDNVSIKLDLDLDDLCS
jgi:hypothetical protein